jgi:CRISPR-associated protein Cmr4
MVNMITATKMLYLYTETPLHVGSGSGLSSIDLPIQRERTTQYPMIQGSGIKGKLRATAEFTELPDLDVLFGSSKTEGKNGNPSATNDENKDHAGALIVGDARILLFPVRSLNGIFAYTTSCNILNRFIRDIGRGKADSPIDWAISALPEISQTETPQALITSSRELVASDNALVLEEFSFKAIPNPEVDRIAQWLANNTLPLYGDREEGAYWQKKIQSSLVILPDNDFRDFALYATEVITRIKIERKSKTVEDGALWTEEHLPTDTLLYAPIYATNSRKNGHTKMGAEILEIASNLNKTPGSYLQLGGDETVGRGIVRTRWGN